MKKSKWQINEERRERRQGENKLNSLVSFTDASELYGKGKTTNNQDEVLLEKMLQLAISHGDLDTIYYHIAVEEKELRRRGYIRRLFDKADQLGYPTSLSED